MKEKDDGHSGKCESCALITDTAAAADRDARLRQEERERCASWKADALVWLRVLAHDFNMGSEPELAALLEGDDD